MSVVSCQILNFTIPNPFFFLLRNVSQRILYLCVFCFPHLHLSICFLCYVYLLFWLQINVVKLSPGIVSSMLLMSPLLGLALLSLGLGTFLLRCYWKCLLWLWHAVLLHCPWLTDLGFFYVPYSTNFCLCLVISFLLSPFGCSNSLVFKPDILSYTLSTLLMRISMEPFNWIVNFSFLTFQGFFFSLFLSLYWIPLSYSTLSPSFSSANFFCSRRVHSV